jgi:hypothetical protein
VWLLLLLVVVVWLLQQLLLVVVIVLLLLVLLSLSLQLLFNLLLLRGAIVLVVLLPAPAAEHLPSLRGARAADALTGRAQQMPRVAPPSVACAQCRTQFMECGNHLRINELAKDPGAATGHMQGGRHCVHPSACRIMAARASSNGRDRVPVTWIGLEASREGQSARPSNARATRPGGFSHTVQTLPCKHKLMEME